MFGSVGICKTSKNLGATKRERLRGNEHWKSQLWPGGGAPPPLLLPGVL